MNTATETLAIRVSGIIFKESLGEEVHWVAQGLQYDICAQGDSIEAATRNFELALMSNLAVSIQLYDKAFQNVPPAPKKYWEMFRAAHISVAREPEPIRMPDAVPMPAIRQDLRLLERAA